ncbi:Y-family DNA polymerase [Methyloceanibacter sp.]|uniref:Y-family DNA polymerase n=1 Tax=Methyloceanibacter sp. TaxID=1965321 RepID=UPI003D6D5BC2
MSRMVSVWLPALPIERLKLTRNGKPYPVDRPFALVGSEDRGLVLTALNAAAMRAGLVPGMGLADARAICPFLLTTPAAPDKDAACLLALARWAGRYSPSLNVDGDDGLWLDVTGVPHLFGGAHTLLDDIARRFARLGFSARLALAETLGGAHALARYAHSSPIVVPQGKIAEALAPLPVEALRLAEEITRLLKRLGLKRIGQLYDPPRVSLERRFHSREAAEAVLSRLDQALGIREEPRAPLLSAPDYAARLPFPEPLITHEGVVAGLDHLAEKLCQALALARRGARRASLAIYRADGSSAVIEAGLSAPSREPSHLARLFEERVDAIDVGFGVDLMVLAALATEPLLPAQTAFAKSEGRERQEPLIDRLVSRLSGAAVRRLAPFASHVPERAQETRSALAGASLWSEPSTAKPPRPFLLLAEPEPLDVLAEIPEGPPARFTWRRVTRRVVKAEGPERIAPEWWLELRSRVGATDSPLPPCGGARSALGRSEGGKSQTQSLSVTPLPTLPHKGGGGASGERDARTRDYYRIEDEDGRRYWVFRAGLYLESDAKDLPAWYLHGVFG